MHNRLHKHFAKEIHAARKRRYPHIYSPALDSLLHEANAERHDGGAHDTEGRHRHEIVGLPLSGIVGPVFTTRVKMK